MKFENEPTDDQLDDLLRDVDVPLDLKSLLKQIPSQADEVLAADERDNQSKIGLNRSVEVGNGKVWLGLILAASLIGVGLFVASHYLPNSGGDPPIVKGGEKVDPGKSNDAPSINDTDNALAEFEFEKRELIEIQAQIHAIEVAKLEAQLFQLERTTAVQVDQREVESIIAAMTQEYSIPLGMPEAKVKSRMAQVIQEFPGTRGAAIAESYLRQSKN